MRWSGPVVAQIDMLLATAVALLALAALVQPPGAPKTVADLAQTEMTAYLFWPDDMNVDIDLWCRAPNDRPVGYSSRTALHADLLRDDLGGRDDTSGKNFEECHFRGLTPGEYVSNAHWYGTFAAAEVPVRLIVQLHRAGDTAQIIVTKEAVLHHQGEELTLARWRLDSSLKFDAASVNDLPIGLRSAK